MTTAEIVLFIWIAFHSVILIWLCFERDRLHKRIKQLDSALGYAWERTVKKVIP